MIRSSGDFWRACCYDRFYGSAVFRRESFRWVKEMRPESGYHGGGHCARAQPVNPAIAVVGRGGKYDNQWK
jgi:hypothetical protein